MVTCVCKIWNIFFSVEIVYTISLLILSYWSSKMVDWLVGV